MRFTLVLVLIAATLLASIDAKSLRTSTTIQDDAEDEERGFVVRDVLTKDLPKVAAKPLEISTKDKVLNALAKLIPNTEKFDGKMVYKNGKWKFTQPLREH
ncbi:hypothetical protein V7S43_010351 [Phytophthora oleae]|uniref:RxLR effector protein n=1 Tax=Phytophthora oleae TaxID=2107226 RepID=A0ABD3FFX8_9STRA